jgi:hypothetical protein
LLTYYCFFYSLWRLYVFVTAGPIIGEKIFKGKWHIKSTYGNLQTYYESTLQKRLSIFPSPPGCHWSNSPWSGIIISIPGQGEFGQWHPGWRQENRYPFLQCRIRMWLTWLGWDLRGPYIPTAPEARWACFRILYPHKVCYPLTDSFSFIHFIFICSYLTVKEGNICTGTMYKGKWSIICKTKVFLPEIVLCLFMFS